MNRKTNLTTAMSRTLHKFLVDRAKRNCRSISGEMEFILTQIMEEEKATKQTDLLPTLGRSKSVAKGRG